MKHEWNDRPARPDLDDPLGSRVCKNCGAVQYRESYERRKSGFYVNGELERGWNQNSRYLGSKLGYRWTPLVGRCRLPSEDS